MRINQSFGLDAQIAAKSCGEEEEDGGGEEGEEGASIHVSYQIQFNFIFCFFFLIQTISNKSIRGKESL